MISSEQFKQCVIDVTKITKAYIDKKQVKVYPVTILLICLLGFNMCVLHRINKINKIGETYKIYKINTIKSVVNKQKLVTINLDVFQITGKYIRGKTECTRYRLIGKVEQYYTECVRIK